MRSHLDIQLNNQSMTLPDDFSIDVTEESPLFHDNGMYSTPVSVPMEGNRHVFQNVDDPNSDLRPVSLEHIPAKINADGLPFRSGTVVITDGEELNGNFSFNIDESAQSFSDLIGDLKCQDIPLFNNELIPVGEKVCDVNVHVNYKQYVHVSIGTNSTINIEADNLSADGSFDPQVLGFSYPGICSSVTPRPSPFDDGDTMSNDQYGGVKEYPEGISVKMPYVTKSYINVSEPYQSLKGVPAENGWRYCNARVCYTHYGLDTSKQEADVVKDGVVVKTGTIGETTSDIERVGENFGMNENYGPYWVLDANRPQSGLCFYVLYFLDCLFNHLGVAFDNTALVNIEDMRRLCFFTTKCKTTTDIASSSQTLSSAEAINRWLEDRGCGGRIEVYDTEEKSLDHVEIDGHDYNVGDLYPAIFEPVKINSIKARAEVKSFTATAKVATMYATNENFPDESVSTVLLSLENSFGIRFRYDYQLNKVTAYLLRDVFRKKDVEGHALAPITLPCEVLSINKLSEKITGVRMKYSAESDNREQQENITKKKRDYETDFDYVDYRQGRTQVSEGYIGIANDLRLENVTCYIDKKTANAYRFKISKDLDTTDIAYHRLFEVGQFKGIEVGDCSKMNEDFVKELISDFMPMSFNDVNAYNELKKGATESILAAYVDEDMEHEFVTQKINHAIASGYVDVYATEVLRLVESYDPTGTDDGNSPLQDYDWGLAIAIMRGGGTDAKIQHYDRGYDGFDNSRWKTLAGKYAMASDTMDQFGNTFDYNGTIEGDGGGERFSLKIRSYKPFLYYIDNRGKTQVTSDLSLLGTPVAPGSDKVWQRPCIADAVVSKRGLADTFMAEYIWFLLNRKKYRIHLLAEVAALIDIPNHWDNLYIIGDKTGYIDKINYSIHRATGIGEVTIDFYAV